MPSVLKTPGIWEAPETVSVWQRLTVGCLAVLSLVGVHYVFYELHGILAPFFLSGFIVFSLQPTVEICYGLMAGLIWPYKWFCCCCTRRGTRRNDQECGLCWRGTATSTSTPELDEEEPLLEQVPTLTVKLCDGGCRLLAVLIALALLGLIFMLFLVLLGHGAMHMKDHWSSYHEGMKRWQKMQDHMFDHASGSVFQESLPKAMEAKLKEAYDKALEEAQAFIWNLLEALLGGVSEGVSRFVLILLLVMFWLMEPLPNGGKASSVVRSYLWKKSVVSAVYGVSVGLLFWALGVDLAVFFGLISFFLNFIPEVGPFIAMAVPVPIILLDARLKHPGPIVLASILAQLVLKFIMNVLEVKLMGQDREMAIHPVWIIFGLTYFSYIWGPLGALMSVPMMAMVKTVALEARGKEQSPTDTAVPAIAESILACMEGRQTCWAEEQEREKEKLEKKLVEDIYGSPMPQFRRPPRPPGALSPGTSDLSPVSHPPDPSSPQYRTTLGIEGSRPGSLQQSPRPSPQSPGSQGLIGAV